MTDANAVSPADTAGVSTENASSNVSDTNQTVDATPNAVDPAGAATPAAALTTAPASGLPPAQIPVVGVDGKTSYVPNYKYKAAMQEKELDAFWHPLIKDVDSEKKVKELFTKVDAFDFVKGKKEHFEGQFNSLLGDYDAMSNTVTKFNQAVKGDDLSSAFRLAGISKDQIFKWTQQQLQLMEMPAEQRAQYEQFEQARTQKTELEERVQSMQQQFETQAVQNRTMQLEFALARPEVTKFAEAWDKNSETPGAFRDFVAEEARKHFFETQMAGKPVDLSPEQAIAMVMKRFGRFLNVGDTTANANPAIPPRSAPPVIPNIVGKASSPIKQVPKSLDDLRKIERSLRHT